MTQYTIVYKTHRCPLWHIDVSIMGKYYYFDESKPYHAKYVTCKCPIIENLKQPIKKQNKEFSLFRFCRMESECLKSIHFEPEIDRM